jgi:hypothetical protein
MSSSSIYACIHNASLSSFKPTFLYIKRHKVTGLLYFGKTSRSEAKMLKYLGSGSHWTNHIKKHGKEHVETIWYNYFEDIHSLVDFAFFFSEFHDIIDSKLWANRKTETGLDFDDGIKRIGVPHTDESKKKIGDTKLGKKRTITKEWRENMSKGHKGKSSGAKNKTWKWKEESSLKGIPRPSLECIHCKRMIPITAINRYHMDNCKLKLS